MGGEFFDGFKNPKLKLGLIASSKGLRLMNITLENKPTPSALSAKENLEYAVIVGPTAGGKSQLAFDLASVLPIEIINCDSTQVYRGFDIGSAKATKEEQARVPHHMLDLVSWSENYDACRYRDQARVTIKEVRSRGKIPLLVGGTGLYLRAVWGYDFHDFPKDETLREQLTHLTNVQIQEKLFALDPARARELHIHDRFRLIRACEIAILTGQTRAESIRQQELSLCPPALLIMCQPAKDDLDLRIKVRTKKLLEADALIEETFQLLHKQDDPCPRMAKPMQTIGYKQVSQFLAGELGRDELEPRMVIATRQYAKRQMTWFKKLNCDMILTNGPSFKNEFNGLEEKITKVFC